MGKTYRGSDKDRLKRQYQENRDKRNKRNLKDEKQKDDLSGRRLRENRRSEED